ncbi:MAG: hypothetical protein FJZ01_15730 [Candidatus Sericytochromatia bacterium]|nr:hypothetical protein [Candidatus Tanganyikabacteria bacterium]
MLCEVAIRGREDLLAAREAVRRAAREAGCDPVVETRLVAGLSDLVERFYHGAAGLLRLRADGRMLEAVLEHGHGCEAVGPGPPDVTEVLLAVGSVRFMWDEVDVSPGLADGLRVVLRAWLR